MCIRVRYEWAVFTDCLRPIRCSLGPTLLVSYSFLYWWLSVRHRSRFFHSCIFHPCCLLPIFPLLHFQRPQCLSVANSTADRLNGLRQSYHPQHTLHELRARRLSKINSTFDLYLATSDLKSVEKSRPSLNTARSRDLLAYGSKQVKTGQHCRKLGRRQRSRLRQRTAARSLCVHRYKLVTGMNTYANV